MGIYLNPPADAFAAILKKNIYVDKSGLISYTNSVLNSSRMLTCFSRPRRFGKSYAAKMLAAYYSKGADSDSLFQNLEISGMDGYKENLNQYDVLFLMLHGSYLFPVIFRILSLKCRTALSRN